MVGGWKRKMLKVLLFLHLFLLVGGVLAWGKGYVSLAYHRYQGVLYEITALLAPYQWHSQKKTPGWREFDIFPLETDLLHVSVYDPEEPGFTDLLIIWQGTLEENLRTLQPPEAVNSLVWVEGVERSGNKEPTLIAWGTVVSQHIYNLDRLWLVFYSFRDSSGGRISPQLRRMHTADYRVAYISRLGSLTRVPWGWEGEKLTSTDILERIRPYRPGVMPINYRLEVLHTQPAENEIFWLFPRPYGGAGWDTPYIFALWGLAIATTPYRYLAYLPLMVVPRVLVWPVAVLWGMLLLASWVWGVVVYWRWR